MADSSAAASPAPAISAALPALSRLAVPASRVPDLPPPPVPAASALAKLFACAAAAAGILALGAALAGYFSPKKGGLTLAESLLTTSRVSPLSSTLPPEPGGGESARSAAQPVGAHSAVAVHSQPAGARSASAARGSDLRPNAAGEGVTAVPVQTVETQATPSSLLPAETASVPTREQKWWAALLFALLFFALASGVSLRLSAAAVAPLGWRADPGGLPILALHTLAFALVVRYMLG